MNIDTVVRRAVGMKSTSGYVGTCQTSVRGLSLSTCQADVRDLSHAAKDRRTPNKVKYWRDALQEPEMLLDGFHEGVGVTERLHVGAPGNWGGCFVRDP